MFMRHKAAHVFWILFLTVMPALMAAGQPLDASRGAPSADGATFWFNALDLGLEGQGWTQLEHPYDRLPAAAKGVVPEPVWSLGHDTAGLCVRFVTDSRSVSARWSLRSQDLAMAHMPATGVSGLDLYARRTDGSWGWAGQGRPSVATGNEQVLVSGVPEGAHEYLLYLPLYNGAESLEIGVQAGASISKAPAYPPERAKAVLVWGTSIVQGGCASRPGMAYPAILARRFDRPFINLGFSGNGRMDPPVTYLIAQLDVAAYVIDCGPNLSPELVTERTEPLVRVLRAAHADTPIVLVECVPYEHSWFVAAAQASYEGKNAALKAAFDRLAAEGVPGLYYVPCDGMFGDDNESTVDGTHPTDVGFLRMADTIEPVLRKALAAAAQ